MQTLKTQRSTVLTPPSAPSKSLFENEARELLEELQGAFAVLLARAGGDPEVPQSVARVLGLDKSLAWKVCQIAREADPFAWARHLPGPGGLQIFFRALRLKGASDESLTRARRAVDGFDSLVKRHAGDRATLEVMLGSLTEKGQRERDERYRKSLFGGASYLWGVQARTIWQAGFLHPSSGPGAAEEIDFARISGLLGFRRLRSGAAWRVASRRVAKDDGSAVSRIRTEALDPRHSAQGNVPLFSEFCSNSLPELRRVEVSSGVTSYEIEPGPVGQTSEVNCLFGTIERSIGTQRITPGNSCGEHLASIDTPAERLVFDFFVHRDLSFAQDLKVHLYGQLKDPVALPQNAEDRFEIPHAEVLESVGHGSDYEAPAEIPRHREATRRVFERTGWDPADFTAKRLTIRYPALSTAVCLRYDLPR